jgi:hypothetical protein
MKTSTLFTLIFIGSANLAFSQGFSYERQLSYKQCQQCSCKKALSYEIVSDDLSPNELNCAEVNNRQELIYRDLTRGGSTAGLLTMPQEGCGDDCDHEFELVSEDVEEITLENCN